MHARDADQEPSWINLGLVCHTLVYMCTTTELAISHHIAAWHGTSHPGRHLFFIFGYVCSAFSVY